MTNQGRKDLKWAMRYALLEQSGYSKEQKKFVKEEATYEQLLNLCFNKKTKEVYFESSILEMVAVSRLLKIEGEDIRATFGKITGSGTGNAGQAKVNIKGNVQAFLNSINKMTNDVKDYFSSPDGIRTSKIGAFVISGITLSVIAAWTFKRFFSAEAKACSYSSNRESCIREYKNKAITATIQRLKTEKVMCSKSFSPSECNTRIDNEIQKWQSKFVPFY
jgi:hypothetical protein